MRAMVDGLYAQRKLQGDTDIIATDDTDTLKRIVAQGKKFEAACKRDDLNDLVKKAYEKAGVKPEGE